MSFLANKRKRSIFVALASIVLAIAVLIGACAIYLGDYYKADAEAIAAFLPQGNTWKEEPNGSLVFEPDGATAGLIFYPGGKVEHAAYIPLMQACAEKGIFCIIAEMPFHLAVFDINAADGIQKEYPQIENWYIGGHSLGGSMAASYLEKHTDEYEGLILLGSYSTADLSDAELEVLSIYGSEDQVLNREKYKDNISHLPKDFKEIVLEGGCHAYFGIYGTQDGDGTPSISNSEQILRTAEYIAQMILSE
ncbi:MAG: alpha/beta hydrolase [Ruminococcaceae bacterium]|nr:alpha/beta hydrolase [Oscillospiraceae bacterium]